MNLHSPKPKAAVNTAIDKRSRQTQAVPTLLYRALSSVVVHENFQNIAISQAQ